MTEDQERASIVAEARTWLATPFAHKARIKGRKGGVDCGQIVAGCFENTGLVPVIETKPYQFQHHLHSSSEDWIAEVTKYAHEIEELNAREGDIVLYKCGRTFSHGGILIERWPGLIIHSRMGCGVEYAHGATNGFLKGRPHRFFSYWGK